LNRPEPLYLDHNAGSPLRPEAKAALLPWLERGWNASSRHRRGQAARTALEEAREVLAKRLGGWPEEWIPVSGATEACNLALRGCPGARPLLAAATEHPAVLETARALWASGIPGGPLAVDATGELGWEAAVEALARHPGALVALMAAHNETGVLQAVARFSREVHRGGGLLFCDLAQAAGKLRVDVREWGVDLAAVSATKFGGPQGSGFLYVRKGLELRPLVTGGGQQRGLRSGTENVAGTVGAAAALEEACLRMDAQEAEWTAAVASLRKELREAFPDIQCVGDGAPKVPNTLCAVFPGLDRDAFLARLDQDGLYISGGAACAAGAVKASETLLAMGYPTASARSALRFSFGPGQGVREAHEAAKRFIAALEAFRKSGLLGPLAK
jgi:cysteine desulfurase